MKRSSLLIIALFILGNSSKAQQTQAVQSTKPYSIIIKGGHVIDPKNNIDGIMDIAIASPQGNQTARTTIPVIEGKIALVARNIDANLGLKVINAKGMYVTPGLIDLHVHVFSGTNLKQQYMNGPSSVWPDGFTFRSGVTTVGDAGSAGWRTFPEFKKNIIDNSKTRILVFLNIVGDGMGQYQQNVNDMDPNKAAEVAIANKNDVVGFKSAHFSGNPFIPLDSAVKAGNIANMPVMLDLTYPSKPVISSTEDLFMKHLRPGDIFTHMYRLTFPFFYDNDKVTPLAIAAQKRGILFDIGHGGNGFTFARAIPSVQQGFLPYSISTDLHIASMNAGMKDMTNIMSKFLNMGLPLQDVILRSTWNPAKEIKREELGNLSVGSVADIAIFTLKKGNFGFIDSHNYLLKGTKKLEAELTIRSGRIVWDLNGIAGRIDKESTELTFK
ncbi:MAG: dihydroorotase [Sphingobacteriales bacterium 17-39-43]|uniref:amidohydrolase/deacetylase family metallohydrolase n=1 Tax=Daejeonella sp. TaxID=2805397 RepID=UPI000BD98B58|nr:amidohydrolase/deacetylase family metallohydrolase [Daejeonella sp.]OYZ31155.1 MAG: dihydroorotase [Sphingobacteriales bacterium 16-39-50]OZA24035.1 MAG: dihydroorotase [Sphingobacteriales bacterium 17-39-43]HQT23199.1 amidohydrolase/deacetylase family metallohydrolase [Daejeonella sp.]HQT58150.1 amidohydrolase/deacetylase family metallohydrolase [Daejeonella sp.]